MAKVSLTHPHKPDDLPKDGDEEVVFYGGERLVFTFDEKSASRAVDFFPRYIVHTEGPFLGQPFNLAPWQFTFLWTVFGWKRADGTRRYRTAYIEIAKKNGKSALGAGLALLLLAADDEPGAQVYVAADSRDQAGIIWSMGHNMALRNEELNERLDFGASVKRISFRDPLTDGTGFFQALSADADTAQGIFPHAVIVDEFHVQPNGELVGTLTASFGNRVQPITVYFTTAGTDLKTVCGIEHTYAEQVLTGRIVNPYYYVAIYAADPKMDWKTDEAAKQANPSWDFLGESFRQDFREQRQRAIDIPAAENMFKRYKLNIWTKQESRYIPMDAWDRCGQIFGNAKGRRGVAALDLAETTDLVALLIVLYPKDGDPRDTGTYDVLCRFWMPEDNIPKRVREGYPYDAWVREGWIKATPGNVVDYETVRKDALELLADFDIIELAFDPHNATDTIQVLQGHGIECVPMRQGFNLSEGLKEFLRLILAGRVRHGGDPVLQWMADNMVVAVDHDNNVRALKDKSKGKIDGIVAGAMAFQRIAAHRNESAPMVSFIGG